MVNFNEPNGLLLKHPQSKPFPNKIITHTPSIYCVRLEETRQFYRENEFLARCHNTITIFLRFLWTSRAIPSQDALIWHFSRKANASLACLQNQTPTQSKKRNGENVFLFRLDTFKLNNICAERNWLTSALTKKNEPYIYYVVPLTTRQHKKQINKQTLWKLLTRVLHLT